tara:strand:+ start:850 stop:1923 length:1074 start_codon:yes stop_codon:yes gene_type:complete
MKKNILLVISSIKDGGTQKNVFDLFNYWKKLGHNVNIVTYDKKVKRVNKKIRKNIINLGLLKESKSLYKSTLHNLKRIIALRKIIKANPKSTILSFLSSTNIITIFAKFGLQNKLIACERNDIKHQDIGKIWHILRIIFYRFANKIITNNKKNLNLLKKIVNKNKIYFIPNHILIKKFPEKKAKKIILSVGRLHPQKGFPELIKAYSLSNAPNKNWKLIILGDGPEKNNLKKLVKNLELENKVFFKGFINPYNWYQKSSIFILTSRFEGTPNALLEAMSMKLAVIITNYSGGMYYVKNKISGLVVPGANLPALAKAIDKIVNSKNLRSKLAIGAQKYIKKLADHKKIFKQWDRSIFN